MPGKKQSYTKSKTLVNFELLCCNMDVLFFQIVETVEQIVITSFNISFSTTAEWVERKLKTVLELVFSKMI